MSASRRASTSVDPNVDPRWQPIADGALGDRTRAALAELQSALQAPRAAWTPVGTPPEIQAAIEASLTGGLAGQALFHAALASAEPSFAAHEERSRCCLEAARAAVARVAMGPDLFAGFTGVAWTIEHLSAEGEDEEDALASIDDTLHRLVEHGSQPLHFDLVSGLTGVGVYALERLPRSGARALLGAVVRRLEARSEPLRVGRAWRTPAPFADPRHGHGPFDLGVAHGLAGVLALLGAACAWDVEAARARALLGDAIDALMSARLEPADGWFPATTGATGEPVPARLAWCYGDAGIAAALQVVADATGERAWADAARAVGLAAAARAPDTSRVEDAGLCHGAAGLALLFQRLHHASGEPAFLDAARRWLSDALDRRRPGEGCAGFSAVLRDGAGRVSRSGDPGLLRGAAGIGLAFLAATSRIEPTWDRALLLSFRRP